MAACCCLSLRVWEIPNCFIIYKFCDAHTCPVKGKLMLKCQCKSGVLGAMLLEKCNDPKINYRCTETRKEMKRGHEITLSYIQNWKGSQKAFTVLRRDPTMSYGKITIYFYILGKHIQEL